MSTINTMCYFRIIGWWILAVVLVIFIIIMTIVFLVKGREVMDQYHAIATKVPGLKQVLGSKARAYDPEKM